MAKLSEEKINEIRSHSDIVEVISKYVPLTKKGKNYVCNCPFHDDHDPSLTISQDKQIFKCFACGAGGNVFSFVSRFENISFVESVIEVAKISQIEIGDIEGYQPVENAQLSPYYKVNQSFIEYTHYMLLSGAHPHILDYLHQRQINDELIKKFEIGYNPKEDALYHYLKAKKFSDEEMVNANLVRLTSQGIHDVFTHRITIPIHDRFGHPIGFTARRVEETDEAKYINTTETACYVKGNIVFNYHRAEAVCRKTKRVLLVEGAMDVLAFNKVGIEDVVATLGTACTKEQLRLLKSLHVKVDICYDGDDAGINAIYKFGKMASASGLHFEVVDNRSGLDPDEIIEKFGKDELISLSNTTISWVDFCFEYLQKKYRLDNYSQKVEFAKEMKLEIERVEEEFLRESYFKKLYDLTQFEMNQIKEKKRELVFPQNPQLFRYGDKCEYVILGQMLISRQAVGIFKDELGFLIHPTCNQLALYLINEYRTKEEISVADLIDKIKEDDVSMLLIDLSEWELAPVQFDLDVLNDAILKVHQKCLEEKIRNLSDLTKRMNSPLDKAKLMNEIIELKRKLNDFVS